MQSVFVCVVIFMLSQSLLSAKESEGKGEEEDEAPTGIRDPNPCEGKSLSWGKSIELAKLFVCMFVCPVPAIIYLTKVSTVRITRLLVPASN